jgi:hypothetical protein
VASSPSENGFLFTVPNQGEIDVPKRLRYETFDKIPLLYYETKSRELAGTFFNEVYFSDGSSRLDKLTIGHNMFPFCQLAKTVLKYLCLHPGESSTDFEVKDDPCFDCSGLCTIKFYGMLCSMMNLSGDLSTTQ